MDLKSKMIKDVTLAARNCQSNIFIDWKSAKNAIIFYYGKKNYIKYGLLLRNVFVHNHGKNL